MQCFGLQFYSLTCHVLTNVLRVVKGEMCGFRKYPYPPRGRPLEIPRGRGVSTAKIEKGKYEAEIPGGREGSNEKTFHEGGMDTFWNHTINTLL